MPSLIDRLNMSAWCDACEYMDEPTFVRQVYIYKKLTEVGLVTHFDNKDDTFWQEVYDASHVLMEAGILKHYPDPHGLGRHLMLPVDKFGDIS